MKKSEFIYKVKELPDDCLNLKRIDVDSNDIQNFDYGSDSLNDKVEVNFFWYMCSLTGIVHDSPPKFVKITDQVINEYNFPKYINALLKIMHSRFGDFILRVEYN
jgi:hypothetical protein